MLRPHPATKGFAWLVVATALAAPGARAQNAPLSGLPQRGTVQSTDIIPIMPVGGAQLMRTTVAGLVPGGGAGSVTSVICGAGLTGGTITTAGTCALADPTVSQIGGVEALVAVAHEYVTSITTSGVPVLARPACADLSDATYCNVSLTNGIALGNLAQASANTLLGNAGGSSANVADVPVPSCAGPAQALDWTSGTGFGCVSTAGTATAPNLLKFGPPTVIPYYDPQPAGLIDVTDNFGSTGTFTTYDSGSGPSFSVSGNVGTLSLTGAGAVIIAETSDTTIAAPQTFVSIHVSGLTGGSGYNQVKVGLCKSGSNYAVAYYDSITHGIDVQLQVSGTFYGLNTGLTLSTPFDLGFAMVGNSLTAWYRDSATNNLWTYSGSHYASTAAYDLTTSGNVSGWQTCAVYANNGSAGSANISSLQGGRFGGVIMRDLKPVVNNDWTTYQPGSNTIYFVATVGDPVGVQTGSLSGSSQGVFTLDLSNQEIVETGVIADARSGHIYPDDAAGSVIYHSNGDREVVESGWGSTSGSVAPLVWYEYVTNGSQGDVLTTNLSVLSSMTQLTLPLGSGAGAYDPALAYDAVNSRYLIAYTIAGTTGIAPFYPALAYASTPTGTWTSVGMDSGLVGNWEGTSFDNVGGIIYELAGGPRDPQITFMPACSAARIYNESFVYQGNFLGATFINSAAPSAVNCSHPTLFQLPDLEHYGVLTFNGIEFGGVANATGQPMIEISTP